MKKQLQTQTIFILGQIIFMIFLPFFSNAQAPNPVLIGYFHNWHDFNSPYVHLDQVDSRYNMIDVAFAVPQAGTDYKMEFVPDQVSQATFISQIQTIQGQGRKVIISMGGATSPISLDNIAERDTFVTTMTNIINTYGFDGIDIDLEGSSLSISGGTISAPADQPIINLIYAIKQIMANYFSQNNHRLILTMAPETAFVQGGQSTFGGMWGAYLPVIDALRDSLEILHVQLYNSGSIFGIDGNIYTQGTADFIIALCEAVIQGFNTTGGMFGGLPASKIAVGLPACSIAAGGGYTDTASVKAAINYLRGSGTQPGSYSLFNASGYPTFRGMMTWSINWDGIPTCGGAYEYAQNFQNIFETATSISTDNNSEKLFSVFPNPTSELLYFNMNNKLSIQKNIRIYNTLGEIVFSKSVTGENETINISNLPNGIYYIILDNYRKQIIKQ
ncbi:MAG: glycosyl hydrolase family 18 protein [Bacteroidota bacterium]|nr:glycosyl hydrolase family 18 protein [Bacteroidota bacterium]